MGVQITLDDPAGNSYIQVKLVCCLGNSSREEVKTTILEQEASNHKIDCGLCLHPPSSTSKDGVFIASHPSIQQ